MHNTSPKNHFLTGCSCVCDLNELFAKQSYVHSSNNAILTISFPLSWVGVQSFLPSNARVIKFYSRTSVPKSYMLHHSWGNGKGEDQCYYHSANHS